MPKKANRQVATRNASPNSETNMRRLEIASSVQWPLPRKVVSRSNTCALPEPQKVRSGETTGNKGHSCGVSRLHATSEPQQSDTKRGMDGGKEPKSDPGYVPNSNMTGGEMASLLQAAATAAQIQIWTSNVASKHSALLKRNPTLPTPSTSVPNQTVTPSINNGAVVKAEITRVRGRETSSGKSFLSLHIPTYMYM